MMRLITFFIFCHVAVGLPQSLSAEAVYFECVDREGDAPSRTIRVDFKDIDSVNMTFMPTSEGAIDRRSEASIREGVRRSGLLLDNKAAFFEAPEINSEKDFWGSVSGKRVLSWIEDANKPLLFEFLAVDRDVDVVRVAKIMTYFFSLDLIEAEIDDFFMVEESVDDYVKGSIPLEFESSLEGSKASFSGSFYKALFSCEGKMKREGFQCINEVVQSWPEGSRPLVILADKSGWIHD